MADRLDELGIHHLERVTGIEPALSAWEADVLPLNYTRAAPGPDGPRLASTSYRNRVSSSATAGPGLARGRT